MNKVRMLSVVWTLVLLLALNAGPGMAEELAPQGTPLGSAFTYQGQLSRGSNLVNGTCNLRFALYDAVSGGNQVGSGLTRTGVSVVGGLFTVPDLDFGIGAFGGEKRWLAVQVQCPGDAGFTALSPRQALTAPPYAFYWGGQFSGPSGGIGLTLTGGMIGLSGIGTSAGVTGSSSTASGIGVIGTSSGADAMGVVGSTTSTSGIGVRGGATASTGATFGVYGQASSTTGHGVHGYASASSGPAWGVWGQSQSTGGGGVRGEASATSGSAYGVYGKSSSALGSGVYGWAAASSGTTYGVRGESALDDLQRGRGIRLRPALHRGHRGIRLRLCPHRGQLWREGQIRLHFRPRGVRRGVRQHWGHLWCLWFLRLEPGWSQWGVRTCQRWRKDLWGAGLELIDHHRGRWGV
jgi:hypothetical protein